MTRKIRWILCKRLATKSYVSLQLPYPVDNLRQAELWVKIYLPGWKLIWGSHCSENKFDELLY